MINNETRYQLSKMGWDDLTLFEQPAYDNSIVGVTEGGRVVYNYDLMVQELIGDCNMDEEQAMGFVDYNTVRSTIYMNDKFAPLIIYSVPKEE